MGNGLQNSQILWDFVSQCEVWHVCLSKVSARWVLKQLTEDQKTPRVTIGKEHLGHFKHDENKLLNFIVTGDEMCVHYAEPETKAQPKQWKQAGSPSPKKFNP